MMSDPLQTYLSALRKKRATGVAREHAYRPPLERLLRDLKPNLTVINDPARIACGAPDYILLANNTPLGYIEAKDVGVHLEDVAETDQLKRYRRSLHNLILTNYLDFYWYVDGELREEASLGRAAGQEIRVNNEGRSAVRDLLARFFSQEAAPIVTAEELARRMAHLARLMDRAITATFEQEKTSGPFHAQYRAFQEALIPSLTPAEFADMYAQTLTYGLFAARVQQLDSGGELTRDTIYKYLPSTNPFLTDFFYQISGPNMPDAVSWLVDDLAHILRRADMHEILRQFGRRKRQEDPIIHFYETFLREYDPKLRQSRGVYYTPEPVVSYIVRSLDAILQSHFDRPLGLADPNTLILDPATGTGTFLYFAIQHIYDKLQTMGQAGSWNSYVKTNLLPRLFGFELLMAPYAVAHLKLGIQLRELGYDFASKERLNIFLTNTLSEPVVNRQTLGFAGFLSQEGAQAAEVKRNKPIEVVLGNPPYSGHSSNTGDWIVDKVRDYYFVDGKPLGERNPKWLQDDYVKFIRWAQWRIEETGRGVVGFVTNHGFLDNPTFRGMRQQLLQAFDEIYIMDLHGNSKKKEVSPDGTKDENVFDIQQGVSVGIFIKKSSSKTQATLFRTDLWGIRTSKYHQLFESDHAQISWNAVNPSAPFYLFIQQDRDLLLEYESNSWSIKQAMPINSTGIVTARDHFTIHDTKEDVWRTVNDFVSLGIEEARKKYNLRKDVRDWKVTLAQQDVRQSGLSQSLIQPILYRPFDRRSTYYTGKTRGFICMPRSEVMNNFISQSNIGFNTCRQTISSQWMHILAIDSLVEDSYVSNKTRERSYSFPLYLYTTPESTAGTLFATTETTREPNLSPGFIRTVEKTLNLTFTVPDSFAIQPPTPADAAVFTPEDIFYYAYAVFHSPTYRERYAEFLKIDFPRLPLTRSQRLFRQLAQFGYELTRLHLMTHPALNQLVTRFPQSGGNEVAKGHPRYVEPTPMGHPGRVFINKTQYFEGVDPDVWAFKIGGYQPLDKWLKDRRGRSLSFDDIMHYQRIVVALQRTRRLMTAVDNAIPGWPLDETSDDDPPPSKDDDPHPDGGNDSSPPEPIPPDVDTPLDELKLFSVRVQNALLRRGIVTLRLLFMHTSELLQQNTKNLGERGVAEIVAALKQWGWALPYQVNDEQVVLIRLITAALRKEPRPLTLPALTKKVNFFNQSKLKTSWSEAAVAVGAAQHPYVEALEDGTYQFNIQPIDTPIILPTPPGDEESSDIKDAPYQGKLDASMIWVENRDGFSGNKSHLDFDLIKEFELLPKRATNALARAGICTPRLLLMHSADLLMQEVKNLGAASLAEIESGLASWGWKLAESVHAENVTLIRLLTAATYNASHPLNLSTIAQRVNQGHAHFAWDEAEIAQAAAIHPYLVEVEDGRYQFIIRPVDTFPSAPASTQPPDASSVSQQEPETIKLDTLWSNWLAGLDEKEREILFLRYGVHGEDPLTLKEVGEASAEKVSRERIRQIEQKGLTRLGNQQHQSYWRPLRQLLAQGIQDAGGLLGIDQWERILDEHAVWEAAEPRPQLLPLLCAVLDDYHFLNRINAATVSHINYGQITQLDGILKKILRQHKQNGLSAEELTQEAQRWLPTDVPSDVHEPAFIIRATDFFERVGPGKNGRYFYLKQKKKPRHPAADSGWAGKPGTRLHEWEMKLRQQFEKVAWLGQLPLTEDDFKTLCLIIQEEAQEPNLQTKVVEGQPRLVPPAVFLTTMTLSARYAEQKPDEAVDEFWNPYLRAVWGVTYSQAFMTRCRKRFVNVLPYLEKTFSFEFPQRSNGDVVTPVFRHALLPRYMQVDFAVWLRKNWRHVLAVADTPELLAAHLQQEHSLDLYYSHRLKQFITGKATAETAAALVANMAAAISLHINDGETIESISNLLSDTPIEQEVWRELAQIFLEAQKSQTGTLRQTKPRLSWIWALDAEEIGLRVQNIIIPADNGLEGEPDRLVWLASSSDDPLSVEIEVEVTPWRMQTGERIIQNVIFEEPDGAANGQLVLLTDMDEEAMRLDLPQPLTGPVQFFRATQQGAYGVPVQPGQVRDGMWLVCAARPLTFLDADNEPIEPDETLPVPYPLDGRFNWAAQLTLHLPVTIKQGAKKLLVLKESGAAPAIAKPVLTGKQPIAPLSRQVQPTFTNTTIALSIAYGGERLLKQASLWIQGQEGWRKQRPLSDLRQHGLAELNETGLHIHLGDLLPSRPNLYTVELRISLQPVFPAPLQFAVVPGLHVIPPEANRVYTPANPPRLELNGVDEAAVVRREGMAVELLGNGRQQITWTDLRHDPRLTLRFDKVDIPLAWQIARFMAWLEPKPKRPFLTREELRQTTLHAVGTRNVVEQFTVFIPGQAGRRVISLRRGRYSAVIGRSQLSDMVRLAKQPHIIVKAQVGADTWPLFTVRRRPQLRRARVEYDAAEQMVLFSTGLQEAWVGNGRFLAESLTNPFLPPAELGRVDALQDVHLLPASLPDGVYLLKVELDGAFLPLPETAVQFTVGASPDDLVQTQGLIKEIRGGQIISPQLAEDFVLWWAEIAEAGAADLTPATLFQLATVPASSFTNFGANHLRKLWPPLVALQAVQTQQDWIEAHGALPAWLFFPNSILLQLDEHGRKLPVYPLRAMQKGRWGEGYALLRLSPAKGSPKMAVFVQWRPASGALVHVEAGLPDSVPNNDWTAVDLLDTYGLYYCQRCGRLTGAKSFTLSDEFEQWHRHGRSQADLRNITVPEKHGGFDLMAELLIDRRGQSLLDAYDEHGIIYPTPETYYPEPSLPVANPIEQADKRIPLLTLAREIKRRGQDGGRLPLWASAARLLDVWYFEKTVSPLGQAALALGVLLRTAAYHPRQFYTLLKDSHLSQTDCQTLLAHLNEAAPHHTAWGLAWAELLYLHSPD